MFRWSDMVGITILVYAGCFGVCLLVNASSVKWHYANVRRRMMTEVGGVAIFTLLSFAVIMAVLNVVIYFLSTAISIPYPTASEVSQSLGLKSGAVYPLVVGQRIDGTRLYVNASGGFFSASVTATGEPASAIPISFTNQDKSYILEIPTNQVTFVQSTAQQPSAVLYIANNEVGGAHVIPHLGPCHVVVNNLFLVCSRSISTTIELEPQTAQAGLSSLIASNLVSATLTLTPEMYDQILGKSE